MKKILFSLVAMTALIACSNDEDFAPVASGEIRVDASIGTMTRVATTGNTATFEKGDLISVFAWTGNGNEVPAYRVVDGIVNTFDGTKWTASPQMLWADMVSEHYFLAVYPARTITDFKADLYELKTDDQMKSDLLIAVNNTGLKAQNNPVQLTFDHTMAKLVVNLHFRDQWATTPTVESVKLEGYTNATVDYLTKTVTGKDKGDVALPALASAPTGYEKSYSSIVIPSTDTKTIRISIGDKDYVYNHATNIPLESGKYTTINLNVGRNTITLANVTISDWAEGEKIDGEAEEVIQYTTSETGGITTYTVYSAAGLQAVNELVRSNLSHNITLAADIDLTDAPKDANGSNWTPIGKDYENPYTGTFDGDGHTITGLVSINSNPYYQGLIGTLGDGSGKGTVKNLTLKDCTITGGEYTGGIAGYCNESTIENVTLKDCTITGDEYVGGIAGYCTKSTIENCTVRATSGKTVSIKGKNNIGGIVGDNQDGSNIIACKVVAEEGIITITQEGTPTTKRIGGIAGNNAISSIIACFAKGVNLVSANTDCVIGGIAGKNGQSSSLTNCYVYGCKKNDAALSDGLNIYGNNSGGIIGCYYTADGKSFGHVNGIDASDWTAVMSVMNSDLITVGYLWQWSGTADNPTLTKK